jgi:hypothetical protein
MTNDKVDRPTTNTIPVQVKPWEDTMDSTTNFTVNRDATAVDELETFMLSCGRFSDV